MDFFLDILLKQPNTGFIDIRWIGHLKKCFRKMNKNIVFANEPFLCLSPVCKASAKLSKNLKMCDSHKIMNGSCIV